MKKLLILGASGSIGKQTIDLVLHNKLEYEIISVSVGKNVEYLKEILNTFKSVKYAYLIDKRYIPDLQKEFNDVKFYSKEDGFKDFIIDSNPDVVVNALVGFVGVLPSIYTIEQGIDLALANKETLVVAGDIVKKLLKASATKLLPIDSEHVAISKCLKHTKKKYVKNLVITCSGGPFRTKNIEELQRVSKKEALNHPTWKMGNKITIDSATLINKVFEIIEAHYLFNYPKDQIRVIIHPESKVHSMVELVDGNMIMDYGLNDMRIPISYALSYENRRDIGLNNQILNNETLHFYEPNEFQKGVLSIANKVLSKKGNMGCILNAANDFLVDKFLKEEISFLDIYRYIDIAMKNIPYIKNPNVQDIISTNNIVKYYLSSLLGER